MAVSGEYKAFIADLLEPLGQVHIRNMFGGAGVYQADIMFGLIADETLYLKVADLNKAAFEEEGMQPFVYRPASGKSVAMSYWQVPDRLYDEPDELLAWARIAADVARSQKAGTAKPKSRAKKKRRA